MNAIQVSVVRHTDVSEVPQRLTVAAAPFLPFFTEFCEFTG